MLFLSYKALHQISTGLASSPCPAPSVPLSCFIFLLSPYQRYVFALCLCPFTKLLGSRDFCSLLYPPGPRIGLTTEEDLRNCLLNVLWISEYKRVMSGRVVRSKGSGPDSLGLQLMVPLGQMAQRLCLVSSHVKWTWWQHSLPSVFGWIKWVITNEAFRVKSGSQYHSACYYYCYYPPFLFEFVTRIKNSKLR